MALCFLDLPGVAGRPGHLVKIEMFEQADTVKLLLGRLSWEAIAFHEPVLLALFVAVALGGLVWVGSMS